MILFLLVVLRWDPEIQYGLNIFPYLDLYLNINILDCCHDVLGKRLKVDRMDSYYNLDAKNWS